MAIAAPHLEAFLDAARSFIGLEESDGANHFTDPRGYEMLSLAGVPGYCGSWCAVFVSACAAKAGIDWEIIAPGTGVGGVTSNTVDWYDAEWIEGPYFTNGNVTPIPGDLISFIGDPAYIYSGYEHGGHIGIVESVDDDGIHTIEGNSSNMCRRNTYALDCGRINGYVRPDWASVGDNISAYLSQAGQMVVGPLYANKNDRHDMTMRQVGYLNNQYQLSNSTSGIAISVINYTTLLGDLWNMFSPATIATSTVQVDTSQLTGNVKIAMDYFLIKGFSASSASALVGCLLTYSGLKPTYIEKRGNIYLYGIAAWDLDKLNNFIKPRLGYEWNMAKNYTGQLDCFMDDLSLNYKGLIALIKTANLDIASVEKTVDTVMAMYNKQFLTGYSIKKAKEQATEVYNALIITQAPIVGSINNLTDENGKLLSATGSVTIPSDVNQTGIIDDYTSYSAFYHRWASGTTQRKLADIWAWQGCPADKGIATIGGYYCVAVRPKFGRCGDVLAVTLEGGETFPAIICDEKGEDAGSEWGHIKDNGRISIIEWERIVTFEGKVQTEGSAYIVDGLGFDDWLGKDVLSITNYGSYLA